MLDLPLRGEQRRDEPEGPDAEAPSPPAAPASRPPRQQQRHRQQEKKRRWPLVLLLLLVVAVAGFAYYRLTTPVAGFSVEALDFGEQRVGGASESLVVTVTNTGTRDMSLSGVRFSGDAATEFEATADDCTASTRAAGESCTIEIIFNPAANGPRAASLALEGNALGHLPISGVGVAPVLVADRGEIDFGPQPVDGRSASRTLNLNNEGAAPMAIERIALTGVQASDFSLTEACTPNELPPGESCAVRVSFTPRAAGERAATLAVEGDGATQTAAIALAGVGVWSGQPLDAQPTEVDFGRQRKGSPSKPVRVGFINRTSEPVEVTEIRLEANDSGVAIDNQDCRQRTLVAGEECGIALRFTPAAEGAARAVVAVKTAAGLETAVEASGTGVEPRLSMEKTSLDFGGIRTGFEERSRAVLTNKGTDTLTFAEAKIAGPQGSFFTKTKDGCSGFSLAPGRTCTIELRFSPGSSGTHRAELRIASDAAGGAKSVALEGRGTAAKLSVSPQSLDFGSVQRPGAADRTLTLRNDGNASVQVKRFSVTGGAAPDFVVASIGCGESGLAAGASCQVTVRFAPRDDGARAARLVLEHDAGGAAVEVALLGTALAARPGFQLSNRSIDFASRPLDSRSPVQTLTVTNTGDGRLELRSVSIDGAQAGEFAIVPGTCDGAPYVAARGSCSIGVRFTPRAAGRRSATLRIQHNAGGPDSVSLSGEGAK